MKKSPNAHSQRTPIYTYHIDLDERGLFMAHVENESGQTIVSYDLPQWNCYLCSNSQVECTCDVPSEDSLIPDWDIFDDVSGILKHSRDVDGLERHYKDVGIMPHNAHLVMAK